ncbi:tyrosinase family protein [Litoreibacter roseus]|uniref:Tyrosinase copper-binding domain-containing protein n=1 Tax=Litoreibacter roseus TaxID=2601869 RepID=A0A6N6JP54_9RHOB|nr:tyrosinase family protein [Litoreibacter roseus]GFE67242.1 hypothetical protein KIN_43160 [Litoreibacter roseus]
MAVIKNPTYMEHIRHFFEEEDHNCMVPRGKDYTTYEGLKDADIEVYSITLPPNATMPKPEARRWDKDKSDSFLNWITNGHPRGEPKPKKPSTGKVGRVRKSLSELNDDEVKLVKKAFQGMMDRDPTDDESYFKIAGVHWFPNQPPNDAYCQHHTAHYHMWHRAYLLRFENAMRSVPDCEDVTLPYWDFSERPPAWINKQPFKSYTLPEAVHPSYPKGHETKRKTPAQLEKSFKDDGVLATIDDAMTKSSWEDFNRTIESAHDTGHPASGASLATANVASFDPLFWFFHANWDRLWWRWQQIMQATTLWTFKSTFISQSTEPFFAAPLNRMRPSFMTADKTINLHALDVTYTQPTAATPLVFASSFGSLAATRSLKAAKEPMMSVRVRDIDRLAIPGSFRVELMADGKSVAARAFFQSTEPNDCPTCRKNALINLDIMVPINKLLGKNLDVKIFAYDMEGRTREFPISSAGTPRINARLPLEVSE